MNIWIVLRDGADDNPGSDGPSEAESCDPIYAVQRNAAT